LTSGGSGATMNLGSGDAVNLPAVLPWRKPRQRARGGVWESSPRACRYSSSRMTFPFLRIVAMSLFLAKRNDVR
jgi:hypothetical protein